MLSCVYLYVKSSICLFVLEISMSSRPVSAKVRPGTATRNGTLKNSDVVSYEDLLVAQYLEELKRSQPYTKNT